MRFGFPALFPLGNYFRRDCCPFDYWPSISEIRIDDDVTLSSRTMCVKWTKPERHEIGVGFNAGQTLFQIALSPNC